MPTLLTFPTPPPERPAEIVRRLCHGQHVNLVYKRLYSLRNLRNIIFIILFNRKHVYPSVLSFVYAVLFVPSFNVLTSNFYV